MPTSQEIRDQYLSNQLFLMGEKFGGYEVIDRRSNYIVVVDATGADKKMFLDEAYTLSTSAKEFAASLGSGPEYANPTGTHTDLESQLHQVYKDYPEYHEAGYHAMVDKFASDPFYKLHHVAKEYLKSPREYRRGPGELEEQKNISLKIERKGVKFSELSAVLSEGVFTYKGFRGTNISKNRECEGVFMSLAEECEDPWALLSAVRAVDAFLEHRTAGTLDRARVAVSRVDDLANHPWLHEDVEGQVASGKSIFTIQPAIEVLDEDLDFTIEEKLTYNGFRVVLTEAFEHDVGRALSKLEKNPSLLDELASSLRSINDIAHHYDHHSVHMHESTLEEDLADKLIAGTAALGAAAAIGLTGWMGHDLYKENEFQTRLEKSAPADYSEYKKHWDAYYSQRGYAGKSTINKNPELAEKSQAAMDAIKTKHKPLTEDLEKAIEHAEKTKKITLRKISSGPQMIKIAKRAAVELIAQKLAGKPVKKISKKEKNVIVDAIKKKKGVVMKLVKKLVPKIRAIEASSAEHEHESEDRGSQEFGSAGS